MTIPRILRAAVFAVLLPSVSTIAATDEKDAAKMGDIATTVARMLESAHYTRQRLNDDVLPGETQAQRALKRYLDLLDYNKLFFTQEDIDEFNDAYGSSLQNDIMLGNLSPAYKIYDRFEQRVSDRVAKIKKLLDKDFTFDSDRAAQLNRDKEPWPANEAAADQIWADRIEAELLQAILAERSLQEAAAKKKDQQKEQAKVSPSPSPKASPAASPAGQPKRTPKETVLKRYERLLKTVQEEGREDQANTFLSALALSYDPHSEYMSQRALDNFNIQMGLSLVGIGAELRSEDGYAKIQGLVPGGPAERGGQLKVNDRIVAVAQGDGEFEDVVDMKLDRVVERIRGKKGTVVRLQVIPAATSDPSKLAVVTIVRDEVKLKDEEAKAQVIEGPDANGKQTKIGWINLPSFYANMDDKGGPPKSTTKDVAALLKRLKKEGIEGLVVDLRRDSGGSLDEAVRLTGLFIPKGPVVQAKDTTGAINALNDPDPGVLWDGPMIVLVNRLSASASEIFAAALQDYGRAVIVGDEKSFGKGTVQTLLPVDRFMPLFSSSGKSGALKVTIQKFYRIKGGSTQLRGVSSDIILPSLTDQPDVGEGSLKNPLEYDEVPPKPFAATGNLAAVIPALRSASAERVAGDQEFAYISEDKTRLHEDIKKNAVSLNKTVRLAELDADKKRREARNEERKGRDKLRFAALEVTLDSVDAPKLTPVALDKPPKRSTFEDTDDENAIAAKDEPYVDPVRDEALLIMEDLIKLQTEPVTASARTGGTTTR